MLKSEAEGLRFGLLTGLVAPRAVVEWADAAIQAGHDAAAPSLLDLSLSSSKDLADIVSLLGRIPGEADVRAVGQFLAHRLALLNASGGLSIVPTARAMYRIVQEGFAPDSDFVDQAYAADDGVDLAERGTYGTLTELQHNVGSFLKRYL